MESYNQFFNGSSSSNVTSTEGAPLFITYLIMVTTLAASIIVITPAVTIINVIWQSRELHTKYFFFVAHLLAINVTNTIVGSATVYLIIILYLFDLNSDSAVAVLKWVAIAPFILLYLMNILSPIPVAIERMIIIAFPFRHRNIMTTKRVTSMLAAMWGISAIVIIIIMITVPFDVFWSIGMMHFHRIIFAILAFPRIISIICIVAANGFLQYKITISNRKAAENQRLGNEDAKRSKNLLQVVRIQAKATITLFIVGGIDVIANILQTVIYVAIDALVEPNMKTYISMFSYQLIETCFYLSRTLVYGLYMKKIRNRLPNWMVCCRQWITRHNRIGILHQQPQRRVNNATN